MRWDGVVNKGVYQGSWPFFGRIAMECSEQVARCVHIANFMFVLLKNPTSFAFSITNVFLPDINAY